MADVQQFKLAASGQEATPEALVAFLQGAVGHPVEIDASPATQVDTLRLQVLLSAARQWDSAGLELKLVNMGDGFRDGMARLGLDPNQFESEVTA